MKKIWQSLGEDFDNNLPRLTATFVKETDGTNAFAYPTGENQLGYNFDFSIKTGYDIVPKFKLEFANFEYPSIMGVLGGNRALIDRQTYYPSMIKREFHYMNLAFTGTERFGNVFDKSFTWSFDIKYNTEQKDFDKNIYSVLTSEDEMTVNAKDNSLTIDFGDMKYYIASTEEFTYGLYANEIDMKLDLRQNKVSAAEKGRYLVLCHKFAIRWKGGCNFVLGLSAYGAKYARRALSAKHFEERIAKRWNGWFNSLPAVGLNEATGASVKREAKTYYKSWTVIKNNYYDHPDWGHSVTEALPVYKGIWQWAIPSVEWHSDQNTEYTSEWIKKAMDMLIASQRGDGYITHAIYIDEKVPGSSWGNSSTIQTPHLAWTAVRYYNATGDAVSLKKWFPALKKYYSYINHSRDEVFNNWHLWAITTSYDTGLDTTAVFQRVTYGDYGENKENFCYPAIFGAERFRYESALAEICEILGEDGADYYRKEAEKTRAAMNEKLWDDDKKWYGAIHENGEFDTRVGVDGLFSLVYGVADTARAKEMKASFERLIGPFGIRTVAEGEKGFCEDVYWRGPCWPKTCSLGMYICNKYYPDLVSKAKAAIIAMCLKFPSIWECYNVRTGELAHSDHGFICTPNISSNVGAGDIIGTLWESHGIRMYDMCMKLPLADIKDFHIAGLRVTVEKTDSGYRVLTAAAEKQEGRVVFFLGEKEFALDLKAGAIELKVKI
ncbi:MAG: hypothetical protein VB118_09250 [Oscillospiraceae bacterium]|nr:hypothetical protein [Oscillospiraceae bacterium]